MDTTPDLLSLRIVRAIAEHGTISEAARALGVSASANPVARLHHYNALARLCTGSPSLPEAC